MSTPLFNHFYKSDLSLDSFKLHGNIHIDECIAKSFTSVDGSIKAVSSTFDNLTAYEKIDLNRVSVTGLVKAETVEGMGCTLNKVRATASISLLLTDVQDLYVDGGSLSLKSNTKKTTLGKAYAYDHITLENVEVTEYVIAGMSLTAKAVTTPFFKATNQITLEDSVVDKLVFIVTSDSASITLKKSTLKELHLINPSHHKLEYSGTFPTLVTSPQP